MTSTATPDLSGFLLAHRAMRQEFGLLAKAALQPFDLERRRLFEEQVEMVLYVLHHHHTAEDTELWPMLRERAPIARPDFDLLEAEHEQLDPLFAIVGDTTVPMAERAAALFDIHLLINAHLDREERVAVPLMRRHITVEEWEAQGRRVQKELGLRRIPRVFGWIASAGTDEQVAAALAEVPGPMRFVFRKVWQPAYARRVRALYGAAAPVSVALAA